MLTFQKLTTNSSWVSIRANSSRKKKTNWGQIWKMRKFSHYLMTLAGSTQMKRISQILLDPSNNNLTMQARISKTSLETALCTTEIVLSMRKIWSLTRNSDRLSMLSAKIWRKSTQSNKSCLHRRRLLHAFYLQLVNTLTLTIKSIRLKINSNLSRG